MSREDTGRFSNEWDPKDDIEVDQVVCQKYKTELYGTLVSLTSGEPLGILRGLQDTDFQFDSYKALVALSQRFDVKTNSSMLSSSLGVVTPKGVKDKDLVPGVHQSERKVADLRARYGEEIKGNLKLA
eukprot:10648799-Karenia_brevis.AAC.1